MEPHPNQLARIIGLFSRLKINFSKNEEDNEEQSFVNIYFLRQKINVAISKISVSFFFVTPMGRKQSIATHTHK